MSSLEQQVLDHQLLNYQASLDRDVFWQCLEESGWTRVVVPRLNNIKHAVDMNEWMSNNCQGQYKWNGREFLFEKQQDAAMFILRWQT